jgi:short-subunit dehydrogenase
MQLTNKKILIVGGSDGIGRAVAAELSKGSNEIAVIARNRQSLEETAKVIAQNGSKAIIKVADALDTALAEKIVGELKGEMGRIDMALLNVGGASDVLEVATGSAEEANMAMRLNFDTMTNYLFPLAKLMKEQSDGGIIAHTNSLAGFLGMPMAMHYNAGKAASRIFLDGARIELEKYNIRIVNLCPGFIETRLQEKNPLPKPFLMSPEAAAKEMVQAIADEKKEHLFPWQLALGTNLGRMQPKWVLSAFFGLAAKK